MRTCLFWCIASLCCGMTPSQVAVYIPIAHSVSNPDRLNVKYDLEKPDGWKRFVVTHVQPLVDKGVKTIQLHNPGGHDLAGGNMRFRQFSIARERGLDYVNDFTEAFRPLVEQGVDVIAYIGCPDDMDILRDRDGNLDRTPGLDENDAWIKHNPYSMRDLRFLIQWEYQHVSQAGVRLGLDAVTEQGPDSLSWWLAHYEAKHGRRPVVEMTAQNQHRHWWGPEFDQVILYRSFRPRQVEGTSLVFLRDWPQLGCGDWYEGTTYILFRSTTSFLSGDLMGQQFRLWRDASPLVGWWNEIRERDATSKIVPMMPPDVLNRLISQDLLKDLVD